MAISLALLAPCCQLPLVPLLDQLLELLLVLLDAVHQLADLLLAAPDQELLLLDEKLDGVLVLEEFGVALEQELRGGVG